MHDPVLHIAVIGQLPDDRNPCPFFYLFPVFYFVIKIKQQHDYHWYNHSDKKRKHDHLVRLRQARSLVKADSTILVLLIVDTSDSSVSSFFCSGKRYNCSFTPICRFLLEIGAFFFGNCVKFLIILGLFGFCLVEHQIRNFPGYC